MTTQINIELFSSSHLNQLVKELVGLDIELSEATNMARRATEKAFITRWKYGKLIHENYDKIIAECGSQQEFASIIGKSPAMISNNLRAYRTLLDYGCYDEESVLALLEVYQIQPTTRNFEKIGTLLSAPKKEDKPEVKLDKDLNYLMDLSSQVSEVMERNLPKNTHVAEEAFELKEHVDRAIEVLRQRNPFYWQWKSKKYLDFVKSRGMDFITGEPAENLDPHHVLPNNRAGGTGRKVADMFTIPVTRETHMKLENGEFTETDVLKALVKTMSEFIYIHVKPDDE